MVNYESPKIHKTTISLALIASIFLGARIVYNLLIPTAPSKALDLSVPNILEAVNKERSSRNLVTLNSNSILSQAADFKAHDIITRKYFSHTDPDGQYIWPKIVSLGYAPYTMLGENLAIEFYSTESLVRAWMDSPTHRANILQEGFRDQGMGLAFGNTQNGEYGTSIANTFGTLLVKKTPAPATTTTTKPAVKKPAPVVKKKAPVKTTKAKKTAEETSTEKTKTENPLFAGLTPRGLMALLPFAPEVSGVKAEPNFQTGQNIQPPTETETLPETPSYQESSNTGTNPYTEFRLWAIIVAIGALTLLAFEARRYIKESIHIPRHRWNTIMMLVITLIVTVLVYLF